MNKHIMNMTLDDIILSNKMTGQSASNRHNHNFRRNKYQEEKCEDMPFKREHEKTPIAGLWKGPEATVAYIDCYDSKKDLREKLNRRSMTRVSAIQYRLQYPNNNPNRPLGMPTLLPLKSGELSCQWTTNSDHRPNRRRNREYNNYFNKPQLHHTDYNSNGLDTSTNDRIYSEGIHNSRKNTRITIKNPRHFNGLYKNQNDRKARNVDVNAAITSINLESRGSINPYYPVEMSEKSGCMPLGGRTPQAQAVLDLESQNTGSITKNGNLKSLLGFQSNVSEAIMPLFASKLLEFVQNGAQANKHKPVYDMKLQNEIHGLQNKPLLYKCNGGEVISSDGNGVNCKIIPRTSGVSLNCRFA